VHIGGERHFEARPEEVYRALTDPDALGAAFAAIERVEAVGDDWTVVIRLPFPGGFRPRFSVHLDELREPQHARLRARGKSLGGRISVDSTFDLAPVSGGTLMRWSAEVDASGLASGLGSQSLGAVATKHADRALDRIARSLERAPARRVLP
jgi:carbon monoxide dehydrogenase subunit G